MSVWAGRASDQPESSVATNLEEILKGVFDFFLLEKGLDRLGRGGGGGGMGLGGFYTVFSPTSKRYIDLLAYGAYMGWGRGDPRASRVCSVSRSKVSLGYVYS